MMNNIDISIIIATRHREEILWQSVEKACGAIENENAEIIIVNDGDLSLSIPPRLVNKVCLFDNPEKGVSAARNFGVEKSSGDIIFFIDDDMWIDSEAMDWINSYIIVNKNTQPVYLVNWQYPPQLKQKLNNTKVGRYLLSSGYDCLWGRLHIDTPQPAHGFYRHNCIGSGALVMHRSVFNRVGGYNTKMHFQGEDLDMATKLNELKIPIFIVFDIMLYHNQVDRLDINDALQRIYEGFGSEFRAVKSGADTPMSRVCYKGVKVLLFELSRKAEKKLISFLGLLPNNFLFEPVNNKILGALGGLQRYKQWRLIIKDHTNNK